MERNQRTFHFFEESNDILPEELDPFGINQSETSAKVKAAQVKNSNQFMVEKMKRPWIETLTSSPCHGLDPAEGSAVSQVPILRKELDANPHLIGEPLLEVDPHYFGRESYVTVTNERGIERLSYHPSLGVFPPESEIRKTAIAIVSSSYFQNLVLLTILLDFLAFVSDSSDAVVKLAVNFFLGVYLTEVVVKIIAFGLIFEEFSYLYPPKYDRIMELVVLMSSIFPLVTNFGAIGSLRSVRLMRAFRVLRVLRLLRVIHILKQTRQIIKTLMSSTTDLQPVLGLFWIILCFVSLISVVFYNGVLLGKCVRDPNTSTNMTFEEYVEWTEDRANWAPGQWGPHRCSVTSPSGSLWDWFHEVDDKAECPKNYSCLVTNSGNPDRGFTNYDTLLLSMLSTMRLLCQDWWDNLYIHLALVNGANMTTLYFCLVIFFGSHYLINLFLSTITLAYQRNQYSATADQMERNRLGVLIQVNRDMQLRRQVEIYNQLLKNGYEHLSEPKFLRRLKEQPFESPPEATHALTGFVPSFRGSKTDRIVDSNNVEAAGKQVNFFTKVDRILTCIVSSDGKGMPTIGVLANTAILMNTMEMVFASPPNEYLQQLSESTNLLFTIIFTMEGILKLYYLKLRFINDQLFVTIVDLGTVSFCLGELLLQGRSESRVAMLLRASRLLRLLKLTAISKEMVKLVNIAMQSLGSALSLVVLSFTIISISAGIGMEAFQETYLEHKETHKPMQNFVDFYNSILVVFRIMCGEWIENLWVCMDLVESKFNKFVCITYFLMNQLIVSLIIFQLYVGILLNKFSEYRAQAQPTEVANAKSGWLGYVKQSRLIKWLRRSSSCRPTDSSLLGRFRKSVVNVVGRTNSPFATYITSTIILSSIVLANEDYSMLHDERRQQVFNYLEIVFLLVFAVELVLKMFAYGPNVYLKSGWRWIDFLIVVFSLADFVLTRITSGSLDAGWVRVLRTLRCLRVLRTANIWQGLSLATSALLRSVRKLIWVLMLLSIVWLMFAIASCSFFSMKFYRCVKEDGSPIEKSIIANRSQCETQNYTWTNKLINFDNIGSSLLALLEIAIFKGWLDIMQDVSDAPLNINEQPNIGSNSSIRMLPYILFIVMGSFFLLGMLIGVVVDSFEEARENLTKPVLTDWQKMVKKDMQHCLMFTGQSKKPPPISKIGAFLQQIVSSIYFDLFSLMLILTAIISMAMQYHPSESELDQLHLPLLEDFILLLFGIELIARILADESHYLMPLLDWNLLDIIIVDLSIAAAISTESVDLQYLRIVRFARVFRMGRFLSQFASIKALRNIWKTIVATLFGMLNILALITLIICVFSIVGVNLFCDQPGNTDPPFNNVFNFRTFQGTWRLLFMVSTSTAFSDYLHASMKFSGNFATYGIIFWVSFLCMSFFVLTNVMVSVVVSNYNDTFDNETSVVQLDAAEQLANLWSEMDRDQTGFLRVEEVSDLLAAMPEEMQVSKPNSAVVSLLEIPITDNVRVSHVDMVKALVRDRMRRLRMGEPEENKDSSKGLMNTKDHTKLTMASNVVKRCWWRRKYRPP